MYINLSSEKAMQTALNTLHSAPINGTITVEIKPRKKNCSGNQRRYWHELLHIIADHQGKTLDELKLELKYSWLPLKEVKANGEVYLYPPSSEDITREQYTELITKSLMLGDFLELKLPLPYNFGYKI